MALVTQVVGTFLVVVGAVAFAVSDTRSVTALIPAVLGLLLFVLGTLATREHLRRNAIHGALALALIGLLGTLPQLAGIPALLGGRAQRPVAVLAGTVTALVLAVYVALGVRSFVAARRSRG